MNIESQEFTKFPLHTGTTTATSGEYAYSGGFNGAQQLEIINTGTGTCTITLEGSFDDTNWYTVGWQQVNALAPARSISPISIAASSANVYAVLDLYGMIRARISAISGTINITATTYAVAV